MAGSDYPMDTKFLTLSDVPFVEKYDFLAAVPAQQLDRNKGIFDCCNRVVIRECIYSKLT